MFLAVREYLCQIRIALYVVIDLEVLVTKTPSQNQKCSVWKIWASCCGLDSLAVQLNMADGILDDLFAAGGVCLCAWLSWNSTSSLSNMALVHISSTLHHWHVGHVHGFGISHLGGKFRTTPRPSVCSSPSESESETGMARGGNAGWGVFGEQSAAF